MSTTMMNSNLIHAFANLALVCPTTAWSQKEVMATINGSDAYTGSGYAQGDEVRITIKPGERVVAGEIGDTAGCRRIPPEGLRKQGR
jgi:hypothetical protein